MEKYKYLIFESDNRTNSISNETMVYSLWFLLFVFFYLSDNFSQQNEIIFWARAIGLIFLLLLPGYLAIVGLWTYKPLNGYFTGELEFGNDYFKINEKVIELADLTDIDIYAQDYYGAQTRTIGSIFSLGLSQGVNNYLKYVDRNGTTKKIFFKQFVKNEYLVLRDFIISAIKLEKMSFLRGIELLGIKDYDEIQKFKLYFR